jgi:hypothetical protein
MWFRHLLLPAVAALVQSLFIASKLDERVAGEIDTAWAGVFAPVLAWLAFELILVVLAFAGVCGGGGGESKNSTDGAAAHYADANVLAAADAARSKSRVRMYDAAINLLMIALLSVFVGLAIARLELDESAPLLGRPDSLVLLWPLNVIPLALAGGALLLLAILLAVRVRAELRQQNGVENRHLLGAAFNCCGSVPQSDGARQRRDKQFSYETNAVYHEQPCAFMLAPSSTYGIADLLFGWLVWLLLLAAIPVLILVAAKADAAALGRTGTALNVLFVPLYVLESLAMLAALMTLVSLFYCWRRTALRPPGRPLGLRNKSASAIFWIVVLTLLIAAQATIGDAVDGTGMLTGVGAAPGTSWLVLFTPLYLLFVTIIVTSCFRVACCHQTSAELERRSPHKHSRWGCFV